MADSELIDTDLSKAMRLAMNVASLGRAARQKAGQMYTWENLGERLMKIYDPILGLGNDNSPGT